jgi:hypothetical protein
MTMFKMTPKQTRKSIVECMEVGLVPFVTSSPGLGKSSIVKQIAKDFNLELIDLRLSQCAPEDLQGLPMKEIDGQGVPRSKFIPFDTFPLARDPLPDGKEGWVLFLDEFNSAMKSVQAAAYKLVLDRLVGNHPLHPNVFVVCAGNLATDRAIVNQLSTAMQSRLVHIEMEVSFDEFMEHAIKEGYDHRVLGYLEFQPSSLHDFKPDHNDRTFRCPRTWEFASRLVKGKPIEDVNLPLLAGTISDGAATELYTFMEEYGKLPSYKQIMLNPEGIPIPDSNSTRYALITMLFDKASFADFPTVIKCVRRLSPEFQVIFLRGMIQRHGDKLRKSPAYIKNIGHLTDFLTGNAHAA